MTSRKHIGLAAGLVLAGLAFAAVAAPASAAWWGNGQYQQDNRWNNRRRWSTTTRPAFRSTSGRKG